MALEPAITEIEVLKDNPALSMLLGWRPDAVKAAKWDRNELAIVLERESLREACALLRDNPQTKFEFLADITCVDWYPSDPRFEVVYNFLSISRKERVRIKVLLDGSDPNLESLTSLWPGANYFEREVFDLFGIRFNGHPNLRRILMPDDWEGHPLRKDYPVEGYR
jgi:NADH-quinone oxidoreductase subunit C